MSGRKPTRAYARWSRIIPKLLTIAANRTPVSSGALPEGYADFYWSIARSPAIPGWLVDEMTDLLLHESVRDFRQITRCLLNMNAHVLAWDAINSAYDGRAKGGAAAARARGQNTVLARSRGLSKLQRYEGAKKQMLTSKSPIKARKLAAEKTYQGFRNLNRILAKRERTSRS